MALIAFASAWTCASEPTLPEAPSGHDDAVLRQHRGSATVETRRAELEARFAGNPPAFA